MEDAGATHDGVIDVEERRNIAHVISVPSVQCGTLLTDGGRKKNGCTCCTHWKTRLSFM